MFSILGDMFGHEFHPIFQKHDIASIRRLHIPIPTFILTRDALSQTLIRFLEPALCVWNVSILKSMKIIISNRLLILDLGHYRAVGLEIIYSSVLFQFNPIMLPLDVLGLCYLLYTLLSLRQSTIEKLTTFLCFLLQPLFQLFFYFPLGVFTFIGFSCKLLKKLLIDPLEIYDVVFCVVQEFQLLILQLIELLLADLQLQSQLVFYLFANKSTPALRRSSVSYLCSILSRFVYSWSILCTLKTSALIISMALAQPSSISVSSWVVNLVGMLYILHSLHMVRILSKMEGRDCWLIYSAFQKLTQLIIKSIRIFMAKVIKTINTLLGPKAIGPYSSARVYNGVMYVSGNIGLDPKTMELVSEDVEKQARQTMENLKVLLQENRLDFNHVLKATIYLKTMDDFSKINKIYSQYFKQGHYPARVCIAVAQLPKKAKFQVQAIVAYPHEKL